MTDAFCAICSDLLEAPTSGACRHNFCRACVTGLVRIASEASCHSTIWWT
ncbi:unnamed protein product [Phaeothamnion confervicola]